jgi:hypothetical protein
MWQRWIIKAELIVRRKRQKKKVNEKAEGKGKRQGAKPQDKG